MFVGMVLRGFRGVMHRMEPVAVSDMGVVRRLLVMLGAGMCTHTLHLSCDDVIIGQSGESAVTVQFSTSKLTPDMLTPW